jgi:hypothetical protein
MSTNVMRLFIRQLLDSRWLLWSDASINEFEMQRQQRTVRRHLCRRDIIKSRTCFQFDGMAVGASPPICSCTVSGGTPFYGATVGVSVNWLPRKVTESRYVAYVQVYLSPSRSLSSPTVTLAVLCVLLHVTSSSRAESIEVGASRAHDDEHRPTCGTS